MKPFEGHFHQCACCGGVLAHSKDDLRACDVFIEQVSQQCMEVERRTT